MSEVTLYVPRRARLPSRVGRYIIGALRGSQAMHRDLLRVVPLTGFVGPGKESTMHLHTI